MSSVMMGVLLLAAMPIECSTDEARHPDQMVLMHGESGDPAGLLTRVAGRAQHQRRSAPHRARHCEHHLTSPGAQPCLKRPCYGPPLSRSAIRCAQHRQEGDVDVINAQCQYRASTSTTTAPGGARRGETGAGPGSRCTKTASFGGADTQWRRAFCTAHRSKHHVNIVQAAKMRAGGGCQDVQASKGGWQRGFGSEMPRLSGNSSSMTHAICRWGDGGKASCWRNAM